MSKGGSDTTGDLPYFFYGAVQGLGQQGVCGLVEHFLPGPSGGDKAGGLQQAQMMGYSGAGHVDNGGDINDAFLCVAQEPEDAQTGGIPQLLQSIGNPGDHFFRWHHLEDLPAFFGVCMIVWQFKMFIHEVTSFLTLQS